MSQRLTCIVTLIFLFASVYYCQTNVSTTNGTSNGTSATNATTVIIPPNGTNSSNVTIAPGNGTNITSELNATTPNTTCNSTTRPCVNIGQGDNLVVNCTNVTVCSDRNITTTCLLSNCTNCSDSLNVGANGTTPANLVASGTNRCRCLNCTTLTTFRDGTSNITQNQTFSYVNFTNTTVPILARKLNSSFQNTIISAWNDNYNMPCSDQRVTNFLGILPNDTDYQRVCKIIVNDWGSIYLPFQCTSLFCNNKGFCQTGKVGNISFSTNVSTPTCRCINGWKGKRCVFNEQTYNYGVNWTKGVNNWLDNINNNTFNQEENFIALVLIANNLVKFTSEVENQEVPIARNTMEKIMSRLYNSNISKSSQNISNSVIDLISSSLNTTDTLLGINPVEAMLRLSLPNGTNGTLFGYSAVPFDPNNDLRVSLRSGSSQRRLLFRKLQNLEYNRNRLNSNPNSPEITVPKAISSVLNSTNNTNNSLNYFTMAFIRDPKPLLYSVSNYIHSQIVGSRGVENSTGNTLNYPNNTEPIRIDLPWSNVPFKLQNTSYKDSCKAYSWKVRDWVHESNCTIEDETDENRVVLKCPNFNILGVSCQNASITINNNFNNVNGSNTGNLPITNLSSAKGFSLSMILLVLIAAIFY